MRCAVREYPVYVFDCDGVILDSNALKSEAFRAIAAPFGGEAAAALVDYHQRHGGLNRQHKIAWLLDEQLRVAATERAGLAARLEAEFGRICREGLQNCALVPGVREFIQSLPVTARAWVVSGGAEEEVRAVLAARGLASHFAGIFGNPVSKRDNLRALQARGCLESCGLYLGDAELDMQLAAEFGLDFLYVYGVSEWRDGRARCPWPQVADFRELLAA